MVEEASLLKETQQRINTNLVSDPGRLFAVLHIRGHQHKVLLGLRKHALQTSPQVTTGDLVMVLADLGAPMGAKIRLEKLLAVGSKDFTLLGRPILPRDLAVVEATVLEKTLSRTKIVQTFVRRSQCRKIKFRRARWTLLRVNDISIATPLGQTRDREGFEEFKEL